MKVCGFTIVRNAVQYDFPVVEAIQSILPVCDKFIVAVGNSEDDTYELIDAIPSKKIEIIKTVWDDSLRVGGKVLANETDKAFDEIPDDYDWAFYIQADEVVHEKYLNTIYKEMQKWKDNNEVDGLLSNYTHFFGTYDYIGDSRKWYRKEIRIIKNNKTIRSYRDAQGFRKDGKKLKVKQIDAQMYHYGWVKHPITMKKKYVNLQRVWRNDEAIKKRTSTDEAFDFSEFDSLSNFIGTHPKVMHKRISDVNWDVSINPTKKKFKFKNFILYYYEKLTGHRPFEYRNYQII